MRDASPHDNSPPSAWEARLQALLAEVDAMATELEGQPAQLLTLLRQVEALHRRIQDGPFRTSLPADRHQFFTLLQAMETSGGWPYIPRLQLRTFLDLLDRAELDREDLDRGKLDLGNQAAIRSLEPQADDGQ